MCTSLLSDLHTFYRMSSYQGLWRQVFLLGFIFNNVFHCVTSSQEGRLNRSCLSSYVNNLIDELKWTSVAVIQEHNEESLLLNTTKQLVYNIHDVNSNSLKDIYTIMFPAVNVIMALNKTLTQQLLMKIDNFDSHSNRTTNFQHHSYLIILTKSQSLLHDALMIRHLENVAVIIQDDVSCPNSPNTCKETHMYTLHNARGGREFVPVSDRRATRATPLARFYPNTQYGYNNRRLLVTTLAAPVYVYKRITNGTAEYTGYVFDILDILSAKLNFSYDVTQPADKKWGVLENGQWNGMVGQLSRREVDIASADISVHHGRSQVVDYIYPSFKSDRLDIIYRKRTDSTGHLFFVAKPIHPGVYLIYVGVIVGLLMLFFLVEHHCFIENEPMCGSTQAVCRQVAEIAWEFVGSVFRQGFQTQPRRNASRILLASSWLLTIVITTIYSANLMAALTAGTETVRISSINDLVDSNYSTGMFVSGTPYDVLRSSEKPVLRRLYDKMLRLSKQDAGIFSSDEDSHMARVMKGEHSFLIYKSSAEVYMANDCLLGLIGEPVSSEYEEITFGVVKGSSLKSDFDGIIYSLKESGMLNALWKKWTTGSNNGQCGVDRRGKPITLREIEGVLLVAGGGLGLSLLAILVELCARHLRRAPLF
ncbi:glutamate receptor ionotropic, kainate 4-like [Haliotis rubra]|uniref:glutamate receptor ionotropic, kainate 4-like n=1 Tax=Haliotis rubra TaxID=36100 RepID=UPI001EE62463|nr:glutamate receptor ionotropic, kainate 4-like [Haliotis rubra]